MDAMTNDEDDDDVDTALATKWPDPDQIVFTVGDDILPRYYTQSAGSVEPAADVVVPYELYPAATADWAQRVRDSSGVVIVCAAPVIVVVFTVGVLLTAGAIRRVQTSVLSTAFYVFVALVVDAFVLWSQCGGEWLRAAVGIDLRHIITSSNAVLCKIYPYVSYLAVNLSSWLTVVMAAETTCIYQRPQRLTSVCQLTRAHRVVAGFLIVLGLLNVYVVWAYTFIQHSSSESADEWACVDKLSDPRALSVDLSWDRDVARLSVSTTRFVVGQMLPYFIVFSCAVQLLTKRWRRADQLRQVDNTWKACNVDATAARQLHTAFSVVCIAHSVLLLPRLAFDSFLLVTDPRLTGQRTVAYRPAVLLARTVVYLLHFVFLAARPLLVFAASSSFRRHVAELCVRCRCCLCCCCCCARQKRRQRRSSSSDGSVGGGGSATTNAGATTADNVQPLLGKTGNEPQTNHVTFDPNTVDLCASRTSSASAAIVLENGAPCIKIFSMTSV